MTHVVVIGLGPAGTVLARVLDRAGVAVLALQPIPGAGARAPLASPAPTLRDRANADALPAATAPQGADRLGGSKHLAAPQNYRLDSGALRLRTRALATGPALRIPPDADLTDWPLGSDELAPYYGRVERLMRVGVRPSTTWTDRMRRAATSSDISPSTPRQRRHEMYRPCSGTRRQNPRRHR